MVARLKLKEIDGRAPPGVNQAVAAATLRRKAARKGEVVSSKSLVLRGDTTKLRETPESPVYQAGVERRRWPR